MNDNGRRYVIYTTCESFMEFVIAEDHRMSMYVVNNNSNQLPLVFEKDDPDLIERSFLYNAFTPEERKIIET